MRFEGRYIILEFRFSGKPIEFGMKGVNGAQERVKDGVAFGIELEER